MTLEGFVRAAGAAMGAARDAFGADAADSEAGDAAAADVFSAPGGRPAGTGQAAGAAGTAWDQLNADAASLNEHNRGAHARIADVLAAAGSGRARINGIIDSATADVHALGPAASTPQGQRALVAALTRRLQETQQALQDGHAEATTHAASSHTTAAAYQTVAQYPSSGAASGPAASPAASTSMAAMPLAGLGGLPGLVGAQPGAPGQGSAGQRTDTSTAGGNAISVVVRRASSQHGTPYVRGGGGPNGPTNGGFDCASLMQYAFAGAGVDLPRSTYEQIVLGRNIAPADIQAGDLIFSGFGDSGIPGPGHVQLAISATHVVEAHPAGANVRISAVPVGRIVVRRILG